MKNAIIAVLLIVSATLFAQDQDETTFNSSFDLGMDIQSRYVWRGIQLGGNSASAQPWAEFTTGKLAIGAWGAYNLGGLGTGNEADLYATFSFSDAFSVTFTDYFFPGEGTGGYFPYNAGHVFEGMVSFAGTASFPIGIFIATNIGGAIQYDDNGEEKSAYSTYVELSYETTIGETGFGLFAGGVFADDNGYYLTDGSGIINVGISASKDIKLSDSFNLPVHAKLILNPDSEDMFLTFGFSI
ncbi:hypothetical protein ACS386_00640 [Flavobacteriaceae bacterium LMO-SS05]